MSFLVSHQEWRVQLDQNDSHQRSEYQEEEHSMSRYLEPTGKRDLKFVDEKMSIARDTDSDQSALEVCLKRR